ncbi:CHAT domain-containing protein [Boletus edulis BED1]|uniref:CHAT domain-containing protein n=1 Tax=Boletus edulis BED1 TaxID=1328754 RepID=A0AAD4G9H0_BOLED|nr:CHAT domain-containing protein [Boletus edulis BED1]
MTSKSGAGEKQSRPNLETTDNLAEDCSRNERPQLESRTSRSRAPTDSIQAPSASDADPQCTGQKFQCKEKTSAHTVITSIRATGVALGLRRLPAGFYTVVHHTGLEWRTENKCSSVGDDVVEWSGPIPLPLDLSAIIRLEVYASFEFQPMLGTGEHLRELTMTVDQLLDCSAKHVPFSLFPKNGDIVSPCSSILVMVNQRNGASSDSSASRILGPLCVTRRLLSTTAALNELEDATSHGHSALSRYQKHGGKRDLERSITEFERALNNCPLDHPCRAAVQSNLALAKLILCQVEDTVTSLEIPIHMYRDALAARPVGHAGRPSTLVQLAAVHLARFKKWRDDLDGARVEALLHEALELSSTDSHENRAVSFMLQLYATHRVGPDHASGQSDSHPSSRLTDEDAWVTSVQLLKRFKRYGDLTDIERAIRLLQRLVKSVSVLGDGYCARLGNLGVALLRRFEHVGELSDLEDAISTLRDANDLTPDGHPDKPSRLNDLSLSFITRFECLRELGDLEHAISTLRNVTDLTPDGHPDKPSRLNNLGSSFITRFERVGELSDLEHAISTHREAVALTPDGHPDKPSRLSSLGNSFITRFERLGELSDLEHAISTLRDATDLTPDGHPDKPSYLNNLGHSFITRFVRLGELNDLEHSILSLREAVDLTPHGHHHKPGMLNNLGNSFIIRFERLGELSDLEHGILTLRDATDLTPHGHPHKPSMLNSLGLSIITRFKRVGELSDLEHAILTLKEAVDLTPHGHPDKLGHMNSLGNSFITRFERLREPSDLKDAISLYSHAASVPIGPISVRFRVSLNWILCARRMHHPSLLRAHSVAINLFPQLAWIGLSLTHRYAELKQGANVVCEAAAGALDSGFPELAVEWLEQGRSVVLGELLQLRGPYEQLSSAHPDHARRLQELSAALEDAGATREKSLSTQEANRHRTLAIERDKLLQEIRRLPGFERFLLSKGFTQLRVSAHSGPVVILNAAETRCDALILLADVDHVIHVPLPDFNLQRSVGLQNMLRTLLGHRDARATPFDDRKGRVVTPWGTGSWETLLSTLFNGVIKPVLDALAFSLRATVGDLSRIFWCPTGPFVFLPIHAAGLYGTQYSSPGHKVSDFVVSSYIPTLSILEKSNFHVAHNDNLCLLLVGQPLSDGQDPLQGVAPELRHIRTVVGNPTSACTTLLESSVGTVEEVLGLMKNADWVHFACHGIQDAANPTDSGLCLADKRRLKISDIIGLSRSRGGLAFLSACQTAMGDEGLTDEAIHIAAGMLFAGYGGVIGMMCGRQAHSIRSAQLPPFEGQAHSINSDKAPRAR